MNTQSKIDEVTQRMFVKAFDGTYGKGLRPDKYEECINELERILPTLGVVHGSSVKALIDSARIQ